MDTHRCAAVAVLVSCSTGCAAGVTLIAAPSVDTTGHFGGEGRAQAIAAAGNDPRLSIESVFEDLAASETSNTFGLFQLALVVRAIPFDTTVKSWTR